MRYLFAFLISFSAALTFATSLPQTFNFSGRLTDSSDAAVVSNSIHATIKIYNRTQTCILYQEEQDIDTSTTDGKFSLDIGSSVGAVKRTASIDPGLPMASVFQNSTAVTGIDNSSSACTYTPAAGDVRYLTMLVSVNGGTTETFASHAIKSVPFAMIAESAYDLQGKTPTSFINVNTTAPKDLSQANLETIFTTTNYTKLVDLLAGTSTLYSKPASNGTTALPSITTPTSPVAGQVWYSAGVIKYYDGTTTQTLGTSSGAISESQLPIIVTAGKVSGDAITSGTIAGTTAINTSGTITTSGIVSATTVKSSGEETRSIKLFEPGSGTNYTQITRPAGGAAVSWVLPLAQGSASSVLTNDGAGTLTWGIPTGGVTSFNTRTGAVVSATNDYTWGQIDKATSSLADLTTRSAADLSSGTLSDTRLSTNIVLKNAANQFSMGGQQIVNAAPATVPLAIKGSTGQTASLSEWKDGSATTLFTVSPTAAPVSSTDLTNKGYVDASVGSYVLKAGDTMTGDLIVSKNTNAGTSIKVVNTNTGTSATPAFNLQNGNSQTANFSLYSPSFGTVGVFSSDDAGLSSSSSLALGAGDPAGVIKFGLGPSYTERMRIDSNGNVGIGIMSPARPLHVNGVMRLEPTALPAGSAGDIAIDSSAGNTLKWFNGATWQSVATVGSVVSWAQVDKTGSSLADLGTRSAADISSGTLADARLSSNVALKNAANTFSVGGQQIVNDTAGNKPLVIKGAASQTAKMTEWQNFSATTIYALDPSGVPSSSTDLTPKGYVDTMVASYVMKAGDTMTGNLRLPTGSATSPALSFTGSTASGLYLPAANTLGFSTLGTERMRIDSAGNVGIGVAAPASPLEVGKVDASGSPNIQSLVASTTHSPTATASGTVRGALITSTYSSNSTSTGNIIGVDAQSTSLGTGSVTNLNAVSGMATVNGSGVVGYAMGGHFTSSRANAASGTINYSYGAFAESNNTVPGIVNNGIGIEADVANTGSGTITTARAGSFNVGASAGTITNGYGVSVGGVKASSLAYGLQVNNIDATTAYGVFIGTMTGTNKYSIYASDSAAVSHFAGSMGVGTTSPSTKLQVAGVISPSADAIYDLGTSTLRFNTIYALNGVISTSDARQKKDVQNSDLGLDFVNSLRPVSYYWKKGDEQLHYGVIAQETEVAIANAKKANGRENEIDNVIVSHDKESDAYGVRYSELIAPVIKAVQELYARLTGVEEGQAALSSRIEKLEQENQQLKTYLCSKDPSAPVCK